MNLGPCDLAEVVNAWGGFVGDSRFYVPVGTKSLPYYLLKKFHTKAKRIFQNVLTNEMITYENNSSSHCQDIFEIHSFLFWPGKF